MLTDNEKQRLEELIAKKSKEKLSDKEFAEFKALKSRAKGKQGKKKNPGKQDPGNDFSWWNKIPELVANSANFKSNYVAGRAIDPEKIPYIVPGVLEIALATCYHSSVGPTDPINVWARDLYLKMFQKYRPASGYSASDLGIAILAGFEVVKAIAQYERIYGIINRYSRLNVNMPAVEATALGLTSVDLAYLQSHLSDFRYDLNYLIRKAQRLCIPKDISFISDIISLLGFEYIDHSNPRGQIIIFTHSGIGIYSDTDLSTGGSITYQRSMALFNFSADNMCFALDNVLSALLGSDSIQRIYADLVVWFGEDAMLQFLPVPEDYIVLPVESKSILHKMHNLEQMPATKDASGHPYASVLTSWAVGGLNTADEGVVLNGSYHVYQHNDSIVTVGVVTDSGSGTPTARSINGTPGKVLAGTDNVYGFDGAHMIDGYDLDITPEFIIEGSLFKYCSEALSPVSRKALIITACTQWLVAAMKLHTNGSAYPTFVFGWSDSNAAAEAGRLALVDWAPLTYNLQLTAGVMQIIQVYGDVDMIVPVSYGDLMRVLTTCFMSGIKTDVPVRQ